MLSPTSGARRSTKGARVYVKLPGEGLGLPGPLPPLLPAGAASDWAVASCRPVLPSREVAPALPPPPPLLLLPARQLLGCQLFGSMELIPPLLLAGARLAAPPAACAGVPTASCALLAPTDCARLGAGAVPRPPAGAAAAAAGDTGTSSTPAARSAASPAAAT